MAAETAQAHKALDLRILEVSHHCDYADYFLLMSASSTRHARALANAFLEAFPDISVRKEGYNHSQWILIDLGEIVVHIFNEPVREIYNLDKLWSHARNLDVMDLVRRKSKTRTAHSNM